MKSIQRRAASAAGFFALVLVGAPGVLSAQAAPRGPEQRGGPPNADTPRILVATFRSDDRTLGVQAADAVRRRLQDEKSMKELFVVTKREIDATLQQSGYSPDSALSTSDLMELGKQVRSDEVLEGSASKASDGVKVSSRLLLKRNTNILSQPLPAATAKNVGDAAKDVERWLGEALKQLPAYKTCENDLRAQKYDAAATDGRAAIQAYPNSTLGRLCILSAYSYSKAPPDSVIKVAEEIIKIDSTSLLALANGAEAYKAKGNTDKFIDYTLRIYRLDTSNESVVESTIDELVRSGRPEKAIPIIDEWIKQNPGDPAKLRKKWQVLLNAKLYKQALATGEELAKLDTATATLDFFNRMAAAAALDSQPQLASQYIARAIQKFPSDADLQFSYAVQLAKAGQLQQALAAAQRAVTINPKLSNGLRYVMSLQLQLGQTDSALATAKRAIDQGANKDTIGASLLAVVGPTVKKAQESKSRDDWQAALKAAQTVDQVVPTAATKFFIGFSAFNIGLDAINQVQELNKQLRSEKKPAAQKDIMARACAETKVAEDNFATAQISVPAGAAYNKDGATQVMSVIQQVSETITQAKKGFCK